MIEDATTASAIALCLEPLGTSTLAQVDQSETSSLIPPMLARQRELSRHLAHRPCVADQRIQNFPDSCLEGATGILRPSRSTFVLDQPGLAHALSFPADSTSPVSDYVENYKVLGGILYNPRDDRRTTVDVSHVAEDGLPILDDEIVVGRDVFARLLAHMINAPDDLLTLPWAPAHAEPVRCFVSLLLRPIIVPEVPGFSAGRSMKIRFIAPGDLVSNLDFVGRILGNSGGPYLPENGASLTSESWTSHTGRVALTPRLTKPIKKGLSPPSWEDATERQRRDGQCWKDENKLYSGGKAFKCVARDECDIIITVITDNYFDYCKKEVKTQISYLANLFGYVEEKHAGGVITYPCYNLDQGFTGVYTPEGLTLEHAVESNPGYLEVHENGSAAAVEDPTMVLVPGGARHSMRSQVIAQTQPDGRESSIWLLVGNTYVASGGHRVHVKYREGDAIRWHLVDTAPWLTRAHKPATVLGDGRLEISKPLLDAFVFGEAYVGDVGEDLDTIQRILDGNYVDRSVDSANKSEHHCSTLPGRRSLGSVIKLLAPSSMYTDEYNVFLESTPDHIKEFIFTVRRLYQPS